MLKPGQILPRRSIIADAFISHQKSKSGAQKVRVVRGKLIACAMTVQDQVPARKPPR